MQVEGDGVGQLLSRHQIAAGGPGGQGAEGAVHVEPEAELIGQGANALQVIDGRRIDRAGIADDGEGPLAGGEIGHDRRAAGVEIQPVVGVDGDLVEGLAAHAHGVAGLAGPAVGFSAAIGHQGRSGVQALFPYVPAGLGDPRRQQAVKIGRRAAADQQAAGVFRKAHQLDQPGDDLLLDQGCGLVIARQVGIHARRQHFGQHAGGRARAHHPAPEAGVTIAGRIGQDVPEEGVIDLVQGHARMGNRFVEPALHLVRYGPPVPLIPGGLLPAHHILNHAPPDGAHGLPVLRIKGHWILLHEP